MCVWFQSGVYRSSAEDSGVDEQTETACEGHGDQLLQDAAGITYRLPYILTDCMFLVHAGFCVQLKRATNLSVLSLRTRG